MAGGTPKTSVNRCEWAGTDPLYVRYHDVEWGVPAHADRHLFEMFILEGAQAGLSWITILRRRQSYRRAFDDFDLEKVARYDGQRIDELLQDPGIVRNRLKVESTVSNAQAFLEVIEEHGSLDAYLWAFVDSQPIVNRWKSIGEVPAETDESRAMSTALRKRGFRFAGPTICYAYMQAVGMVNDHVANCYRWPEVQTHASL
jgi:DNA-3-methyladenine glycosylase I